MKEKRRSPEDSTVYAAVGSGKSALITFPDDHPLPVASLDELRRMQRAVSQALRTGFVDIT